MFTGIIEEIGIVKGIEHKENLSLLKVAARKVCVGISPAESISVSGACLTVIENMNRVLTFEMMRETINKTTLGKLKKGDAVNLERPIKNDGRLHGHFVTGHVDQVATIVARIDKKNYRELRVSLARDVKPYIVPKGSVAIDGVSLTVGNVFKDFFSVYLIPFTIKVTTLGQKKKGDRINLETDILAKYIIRLRRKPRTLVRG